MIFEIRYHADGHTRLLCVDQSEENVDMLAEVTYEGGAAKLVLTPKHPLELLDVRCVLPEKFKKSDVLFLNGYQSWTDSHEKTINETERGVDHLPGFVQNTFALRSYGDYDFAEYTGKKGELHGWSYGYIRRGQDYKLFASLSEYDGFTEIRFCAPMQTVIIRRDCAGLVISAPYTALNFVILKGAENEVFERWRYHPHGIAPPSAKPIHGLHQLVQPLSGHLRGEAPEEPGGRGAESHALGHVPDRRRLSRPPWATGSQWTRRSSRTASSP